MFYNPYLIIPFVAWVITQTLKFVLAAAKGNLDLRYLYASGGMPSVHSAVVTSLAATAFLIDGPNSQIFGLSTILAAIVMYDSFGVRRASGEQAAALNMVIAGLATNKIRIGQPGLKLREILGHKPLEVLVGAVLGAFLAVAFNLNRVQAQLDFLTTIPGRLEFAVYLGVFGVVLLAGLITRVLLPGRKRKSAALKRVAKDVLGGTQAAGWTGLALAFMQNERIAVAGWRLWSILTLSGLVVWLGFIWYRYNKTLPAALSEEREQARRSRWLPQPKKKR